MPNFSAFCTVLKQHFAHSSVVKDLKNSRTAQYGKTKNTLHEKLNVVHLPRALGTGDSDSLLDTYEPVCVRDFLKSFNVVCITLILLFFRPLPCSGIALFTSLPQLFLYLTQSLPLLRAILGLASFPFIPLTLLFGLTSSTFLAFSGGNRIRLSLFVSFGLCLGAHFRAMSPQTLQTSQLETAVCGSVLLFIRRLRRVGGNTPS
jgi:hypothetical protein